jgi:hypothetical protein
MKQTGKTTFLLAVSLIILFGVLGAYIYMYSEIATSTERIAGARQRSLSAEAKKEYIKNYIKAYENTAADWNRLDSFFIPNDRFVSFIDALENLNPGKISIVSIDKDDLENAALGKVGRMSAHVETSGDWNSIMKTLKTVENIPYGSTVRNVKLVSGEEQGSKDKSLWKMSFDIQAMVIVPVSASAPVNLNAKP